jgi:hypothetical protein
VTILLQLRLRHPAIALDGARIASLLNEGFCILTLLFELVLTPWDPSLGTLHPGLRCGGPCSGE